MCLIYGTLSFNIMHTILKDKTKEYFGSDFSPIQTEIATEVISAVACLATVAILNVIHIT